MATQTKVTETNQTADSRPKRHDAVVPAPVSGPVPPGLNDTRADGDPIIGHFVEVTKGKDEGFFGVLYQVDGTNGVVRSRRDPGVTIVAPLTSLKAQDSFRR